MHVRWRGHEEDHRARGVEAWLPPLLLGVASLALTIALLGFIVVALPLRGRIPLPGATIPAAIAVCGALALWMVFRAVLQIRAGVRAFREERRPRIRPR
jgi:hypothetical protein